MTETDRPQERISAPLTAEQQKLCLENIRRCKAYAALPPEEKWKPFAVDGKEIRAKKRTHTGVHHTYTGTPLGASILDLSAAEPFKRIA